MKKQYIRFRIDSLSYKAVQRLALHNDEHGARIIHTLISQYVRWSEIESEAKKMRAEAERLGVI